MPAHISRPAARILVVEDEPDIGELLVHGLRKDGLEVTLVELGREAMDALRRETPDLVVLDLMLPDMDGLEVLKMLRRTESLARTKVIILTAKRDEVDRILGFELGADDYVTKPFSPRELSLRVRAVLQRAAEPEQASTEILRAGPIEIDAEHHEARVAGRGLKLTLTEFRLLAELVRAGGRVRSRESLLSDVWGYDAEVMSRTVDTHVRRLRTKLGSAASWLDTVRGIGYRIQEPR